MVGCWIKEGQGNKVVWPAHSRLCARKHFEVNSIFSLSRRNHVKRRPQEAKDLIRGRGKTFSWWTLDNNYTVWHQTQLVCLCERERERVRARGLPWTNKEQPLSRIRYDINMLASLFSFVIAWPNMFYSPLSKRPLKWTSLSDIFYWEEQHLF